MSSPGKEISGSLIEDSVIQDALQKGLDLRQYAQQVESELREVENASIQDYIKESQNIASLHNQIASCDDILGRMEQMLLGFQDDLGSISSEIVSLQKQSLEMSHRLSNRQSVRGELSQFVDEMAVPEALMTTILESPVTEKEFVEQLYTLNHKINFVKEQSFRDALSCNDVKEVLEKLRMKAIAKIREYLMMQVQKFKKPMANYQIPQNAMLKHKFFYEFLLAHERSIAKEVRDEYVDCVSKVYYSYFKSYSSRLMKLQYDDLATKDDMLGVEDTASRGILFTKPSLKNKATVFTIGNRDHVLTTDLEAPIIVPHAAAKTENKYPYEAIFRSEQYAVVDNCCREYLFLVEFFLVKNNLAQEMFNQVMGKTLTMVLKNVEVWSQESYDSIALFLCIHLVYRYQLMCHKRSVPALNKYWDLCLEYLWPRFVYIVQLNIQSIQACDPSKMGPIDLRPHYITRRYAEFTAAIVGLNESVPHERVAQLLSQLQEEVENFILKMAAGFPQRQEQLIFLINNYDMMLSVIMERTSDDSKEAGSFRDQLSARSGEYVEEVLAKHFGGIIQFVKESEAAVEKGQHEMLKREERRVGSLIQSFSANWKKSLDEIQGDVLSSFPNFKNGTNILQQALTQFVQYYHRFQKVLGQPALKNVPGKAQLVNIHQLMVEVKKYKPNF